AATGRALHRQRRPRRRRGARLLSAPAGTGGRTGPPGAAGSPGSGGDGRGLPPLGLGAGRWPRRGDLRLHGGLRAGRAAAGHRLGEDPGPRPGGFGRGYMLRRYGLLRGHSAPRALATESVVVLADLLVSRDLAALRGRVSGWRAGGSATRRAQPPHEAMDRSIGFRDSLAMRRGVY